MKKYIVKLCAKNEDEDIQLLEIEIDIDENEYADSEDYYATKQAIDYYYQNKWSNCEWRKDEFETEMNNFKKLVRSIRDKSMLNYFPNEQMIMEEYATALRGHLGSVDMSIENFKKLDIYSKIQYLHEIGCQLTYIAYPYDKADTFEKIKI